jgi:two-component system LytT family response regulator
MSATALIRTLIVDDEAPARSRLRHLLRDEPDFAVVGECANGHQALEVLRKDPLDVAFLDIQMPRLSGLDLCGQLAVPGSTMPLVVFVTAFDEYAVRAFEVHAVDYLLKPFDRERFQKTLSHVRRQLQAPKPGALHARVAALLAEFRPEARQADRLVYRQSGRIIFIRTGSIDWIEADGNYLRVHAGAEAHHVRDTLGSIEGKLPARSFMRVSRSAIVNLDRVKELQPLFYGDYVVILQNGSRVNMSRTHRDRLDALLERKTTEP